MFIFNLYLNFFKLKKIIIYIILILGVVSCECVPIINTNKDIIPTQFGYISFINIRDIDIPISVKSNSLIIANKIDYCNKDSVYTFQSYKFSIGFSNIIISEYYIDTFKQFFKPILSFCVDIELDKRYSAIIYNDNTLNSCIFLCDSLDLFDDMFAKIRFINLSNEDIYIYMNNELNFTCEKYGHTKLFSANDLLNNNAIIKDIRDKNILVINNNKFIFKDNSVYNIIYKGDDSIYLSKYDY